MVFTLVFHVQKTKYNNSKTVTKVATLPMLLIFDYFKKKILVRSYIFSGSKLFKTVF